MGFVTTLSKEVSYAGGIITRDNEWELCFAEAREFRTGWCPAMFFSGTVSAIPVPTRDHRIITLQISAYARKDSGAKRPSLGENVSSEGWSVDHLSGRCRRDLHRQRCLFNLCRQPRWQRLRLRKDSGNGFPNDGDSSVSAKLSVGLLYEAYELTFQCTT
jgi:hypothetical protein